MNRFEELYQQKLTTADQAVMPIESDSIVVLPLANGAPPLLMDALAKRIVNDEIKNITTIGALEVKPSQLLLPQIAEKGSMYESGFVGPATRYWLQTGVFTGAPIILSIASDQALRTRPRVETVMYVVSPMDEHGFFSTGVNTDWAWDIAMFGKEIKNIIVEVNEHMPRTFGDNQFHISDVAAIIENHVPLVAVPPIPITREDEIIGNYVAEQIPDEACVQLGVGGIPNAIANFLSDKKDLSVHTEVIVDSYLDLYEKGVITSRKKSFKHFKWLSSFVLGSQKLYDFVNNNPMIEMHGTGFVNDPDIIGRNDNMMSINSTLEVDFTGQCNSENIAHLPYSGIGGQADFVRGAWKSKGGKSFLCTYSTFTDKEGKMHSKIVPTLAPGSPVSTHRGDTQYVVTEYGIVNLKGESFRTRAKRLISIAHPDFRDQLTFEAKRLGYFS